MLDCHGRALARALGGGLPIKAVLLGTRIHSSVTLARAVPMSQARAQSLRMTCARVYSHHCLDSLVHHLYYETASSRDGSMVFSSPPAARVLAPVLPGAFKRLPVCGLSESMGLPTNAQAVHLRLIAMTQAGTPPVVTQLPDILVECPDVISNSSTDFDTCSLFPPRLRFHQKVLRLSLAHTAFTLLPPNKWTPFWIKSSRLTSFNTLRCHEREGQLLKLLTYHRNPVASASRSITRSCVFGQFPIPCVHEQARVRSDTFSPRPRFFVQSDNRA